MLHCGEIQAAKNIIWGFCNVIVYPVPLDLVMSHVQHLRVHHFQIVSVVTTLAAQDCFSISRQVGVVAISHACNAVATTSLPRFALSGRQLGTCLAHMRVGLSVHIFVSIPLLGLGPVAMEVQDGFQRGLGEIIRYHLVLLRPNPSVTCTVCKLIQLLRVPVGLWVLVSRTAIVEIGIVHGPNIFWYLLEGQIKVLLITLQIIFQVINFQVYLVNRTFDGLFLLLSTRWFWFLLLDYRWVNNGSNGVFVGFLDLQLVSHGLVLG